MARHILKLNSDNIFTLYHLQAVPEYEAIKYRFGALKNYITIRDQFSTEIIKGLTGSTAAVVVAVAGVCGCGWLRFLAVLRDLYDWFCG